MYILGLNAYHGDSSAAIIKDGKLIAAAEEERFNRIKYWSGFPRNAIEYCLKEANIKPEELDYISMNRNTSANLLRKIMYVVKNRPPISMLKDRIFNRRKIESIKDEFCRIFEIEKNNLKAEFKHVEHHLAHVASSYLVSNYQKSALLSVDGLGDFASCLHATGEGNSIKILKKVYSPHSLGSFYLAITQFLGFPEYGAEYKVMGLAPYGRPIYLNEMRKIVQSKDDGTFQLDMRYFVHYREGVEMAWHNTAPTISRVYTQNLAELLGPQRESKSEITQRHKDIAASLQAMYEEVFFSLLNWLYSKTKLNNLCLAGGCAMNSVANGKIFERSPFKNVYIQSAPGDAGGSIGAAFYTWSVLNDNERTFTMDHAYWGPKFNEAEISETINEASDELKKENCETEKIDDEDELCVKTAALIAEGNVVGWFQGRMEWGPRALGNRSIVCDPRRSDMKDILNLKIKRRESFRPFAPSILREHVHEWFETDDDVPFMLQVYMIRESKQAQIPAVTHVNGSGRLQTVTAEQNPLYYKLIVAFQKETGVPIVLNTSFNENEPVVCTPKEALDCFLRTKMDVLVLGNFFLRRSS